MLYGVAYAGVFGDALVCEVYLAVLVYGYVLQEGVPSDGVVDIRFGVLVQVDYLCVAAALEVEDAVVVPAVLVVAYQQALGVGGESGLACAGEAEEDCGVLAFHIGVGGAVHGCDALERQVVVHHGEHALFHLAAVPCVQYNLLSGRYIERYAGLGVEAELLVVVYLGLGGGVDHEVGLEALQFLSGGLDEHVLYEVSLPCNFHDEADCHAGVLVGAAESVHNEEPLAGELLLSQVLYDSPGVFCHGVVVVGILRSGPPDGVLGVLVHYYVFILGGSAGVDTCHYVDSVQLCELSYIVACEAFLHFFLEEELVGGVVDYLGCAVDPVFAKIQFCHSCCFLPFPRCALYITLTIHYTTLIAVGEGFASGGTVWHTGTVLRCRSAPENRPREPNRPLKLILRCRGAAGQAALCRCPKGGCGPGGLCPLRKDPAPGRLRPRLPLLRQR